MTKELLIVTGDLKGEVEICETDTLKDVRALILEEFDDEMLPFQDFCFHVNDIRISEKQERKKQAWNLSTISLHSKSELGTKRKLESPSSSPQSPLKRVRWDIENNTEHPMEEINQVKQHNKDEEKLSSVLKPVLKRNRSTSPPQMPKRNKSNSPPQMNQDAGTGLRIPTFKQVKPLLKKAGYTFRKGVYCRPKGDPKKYPNAVLGNDYFTTESAFREFLCRIGVDCVGNEWTNDENKNVIPNVLTPWIRYSVIKSCEEKNVLPALELTERDALILLKNDLNFCYSSTPHGYMLPDVVKTEAKLGVNTFPEKPDLWVYLARNGLPDSCPFENITASERLALEQFIAAFDHEDVDL